MAAKRPFLTTHRLITLVSGKRMAPTVVVVVRMLLRIIEIMGIEPPTKPFGVIRFDDLILAVEAVHLLEVVEDHAGEKTCTAASADNADLVLASLDRT